MRPSTLTPRSLLAASSLLLLAIVIGCGDGKPSRKDRHHDDHAAADAAATTGQSAPSDDGKKDKHKHDKDTQDGATAATDAASTAPGDDGKKGKKADKRTHDHAAKPTDVQWLLTMHGEDGKPQGVWGLTGEGELKGPVNAPLPAGPAGLAPHDLRGLTPLPDGGFLAMNAFSKDTRILHFGPKDANGQYPFVGNFVELGPKNPAMVHAYQMAVSAEGQVYVSNQDTNTVTRYVGLGQPNAGEPMSPPPALTHLADLAPGVVVPNAKSSPEGVAEVRGIAFGPEGQLYVCDRTGSRVSVYDPATGRRIRIVADASHGLVHPIQVTFSTDGLTMYVGDNGCDSVFKVTLATGAVETFVKKGDGGLKAPSALVIKGDWLYVGSREGKQILRYRLKDGKADDKPFANLPDNPEFLLHLGE